MPTKPGPDGNLWRGVGNMLLVYVMLGLAVAGWLVRDADVARWLR